MNNNKICKICNKTLEACRFFGKQKCCMDCLDKNNKRRACEHSRDKNRCRLCSNQKKISKQKWIQHSRTSDKHYNRFDKENFIDMEFLDNLVESVTHCIYPDCGLKLQYESRDLPGFATIERKNNSIGHTKENCTLACYNCNCKRKQSEEVVNININININITNLNNFM